MSKLRLGSASLLSKWGFNDGDCPDDLLDWCDAQNFDIDYPHNWHRVLRVLVREKLAPALEQQVEIVDVGTYTHNPIRALTVDGVDVVRCWQRRREEPTLTPSCVEIPFEEVMRIAQEIETREGMARPDDD